MWLFRSKPKPDMETHVGRVEMWQKHLRSLPDNYELSQQELDITALLIKNTNARQLGHVQGFVYEDEPGYKEAVAAQQRKI